MQNSFLQILKIVPLTQHQKVSSVRCSKIAPPPPKKKNIPPELNGGLSNPIKKWKGDKNNQTCSIYVRWGVHGRYNWITVNCEKIFFSSYDSDFKRWCHTLLPNIINCSLSSCFPWIFLVPKIMFWSYLTMIVPEQTIRSCMQM